MNNSNQQPIVPPFFNLIVMHALLQAQLQSGNHIPITMAQQQEHQSPSSPGPSHGNRRGGRRRRAVAREQYQVLVSSGTIAHDHSPSILPGIARMDANNTGAGRVHGPPSRNTSMVDRNSGKRKGKKPYHRHRSGKSQPKRDRDVVGPSVYEMPCTDSEGMLIS